MVIEMHAGQLIRTRYYNPIQGWRKSTMGWCLPCTYSPKLNVIPGTPNDSLSPTRTEVSPVRCGTQKLFFPRNTWNEVVSVLMMTKILVNVLFTHFREFFFPQSPKSQAENRKRESQICFLASLFRLCSSVDQSRIPVRPGLSFDSERPVFIPSFWAGNIQNRSRN